MGVPSNLLKTNLIWMKFLLTLSVVQDENGCAKRLLPINYQYELSAWIYKILNRGNSTFSEWLHSNGYTTEENKVFKLFCFSNLRIDRFKIEGDRLEVLSDSVALEISFLPVEAIDPFVKGLFMAQDFLLGDKVSSMHFRVTAVQRLDDPPLTETMRFKALSPIFMDLRVEGRKHPLYLSPKDEGYAELFFKNLNDKYKAFNKSRFGFDTSGCTLKVLDKPKRKAIKIKANNSEQTTLVAYLYTFEVTAPIELLRMGYYCGFGSANSQGFGAVRVLKG